MTRSESSYEILQSLDISTVVSGAIDGRLSNESGVGQAQIIEQDAERLFANGSLPYMLMAVELGPTRRLRVVAVNNFYVVQANGCIEMLECLVDAFFCDDVVSRDVGVAGVDAGCDGNQTAKAVDDFGHLLEAASQGKFSASCTFDKDSETRFFKIKSLGGGGDCRRSLQQASFAVGASE